MMGRTSITYITRYVSRNGYLILAFLLLFLVTNYQLSLATSNTICICTVCGEPETYDFGPTAILLTEM